jgi:hypothetical protein
MWQREQPIDLILGVLHNKFAYFQFSISKKYHA